MAETTHKISQRHYTLTLSVPSPDEYPQPELTKAIDDVAVELEGYVMDEDISADIDIEFVVDVAALIPYIETKRKGYTLTVELGGSVDASQILSAIASDLVDMYDEMDVDYTDDLVDFQVYFGLEPSQSIPKSTKTKRPRKKPPNAVSAVSEASQDQPSLFEPSPVRDVAPPSEQGVEDNEDIEVATQSESLAAYDDFAYPYSDVFAVLDSSKKLREALGIGDSSLGEMGLADAALLVTSVLSANKIKRVHDVLIGDSIRARRAPSPKEMTLLLWVVACVNLLRSRKIEAVLYESDARFNSSDMRTFSNVVSGKVHSTVIPGYKSVALKALVVLDSEPELYSLGSNGKIQENQGLIERALVDSFVGCLNDEAKTELRKIVAFLSARNDLLKALEIEEVWKSLRSEGARIMVIAMSAGESSRIKRVHKAIVKVCKDEDRSASEQEAGLLADMLTIYTLSNPLAENEPEFEVAKNARFDEAKMQAVSGDQGRVDKTLVIGIPKFKLKPLVRLKS